MVKYECLCGYITEMRANLRRHINRKSCSEIRMKKLKIWKNL